MKSCIRVTYSRDAPDWIKSIPNLPMSWNASQHVIECASFSPKIALSRDGQFLAYTSKTSHQVDLRDPKTGDLRYTLNSDKIYTYTCLEFSPDSKFLACAAWNPRVELWDLKTRKVRVLEGHSNGVHALAFSSDGELLVTASDDKSVRLWDPHTGASKAVFTGHSHVVRTVVFSPNNQLIVSASYGQNIRLWSPITQEACGILRGHLDMISAVAVSPDNQYIASGSRDKTVRLWDLNNLTSIELIGHSDYISAVIFSPDGQLLVSGDFDGMIGLWHPVTGVSLAILKHHSSAISRLSFFPDSRFFGSASNDKTVRIWDTTRRVLHTTFEGHSDSVYDVKISHDSRLVASVSSDRTVRLWYPQAETQSIEFERHTNTVSDISFSPNGQLVASSAYDGTIKLWDPSTGTLYRTLVGHEYHFTGLVEFSPNGEILASADRYVIRLWDPITGVPLKTLNIGFGWINKLSFSPTSKLLASGAGQGNNNHWAGMKATVGMMQGEENPATYKNVRVWDTSTGSCCCVFSCDVDEGNRGSTELEAFVFSEDEKLLAALTYGRVWIWNLETKELVQKLDRQDVALHQPNASLVLESERDRDILTRTFPGICLDQPRLDPPLYVDEEWVTWRTERVLWIPPDYRPTCVGVRDSILVIGHGSGRLTFIEFDLDKIPFCGSPGGEIWGTGIAT
jgi:WD40 repeat protein